MVGTHFIDQIVQLSNRPPSVPKTKLNQKIDNLLDLIKLRIASFSMNDLADSLRDQITDLRSFINKHFAETSTTEATPEPSIQITEAMVRDYVELVQTIAEVVEAYAKVVRSLKNIGEEYYNEMVEFDSSKNPDSNAASRKLMDKLTDLELSLLISRLVLRQVIHPKKSKLKELMSFMINAVSSFGGHAIYLKFWKPEEDDDSRMTQNMEMLASIYGVEYGRGYRLNKDGQKIMIEA